MSCLVHDRHDRRAIARPGGPWRLRLWSDSARRRMAWWLVAALLVAVWDDED